EIEQLNNIRKHAKEMEEKINQFRNMLSEIINEEKSEIISTMLQIRKLVIELSQTKQEEIQKMLNKTLNELQDLAQEEGIPVE
ncbi:MAG: hypothetical protein KGY65_08650, partial [Candidatus Thermoplasmatota archaeon]|nr:hypothetical protein [Candidatus Thermoplasmatota archaeon]